MATIYTHAVAGLGIAQVYLPIRRRWLYWTIAGLLAVVPDLDTFSTAAYGSTLGHRGFTHSLPFALWCGFLAASLTFRALDMNFWLLSAIFSAAIASHGLLDAMTRGGENIPFFWPASAERFGNWGPLPLSDIAFQLPDPRRSRALRSEMLWIWLPVILFGLSMAFWRRKRTMLFVTCFVTLTAACSGSLSAASPGSAERLRVIIETDAGGDPDDEQSLVRFLLYANEWDVEGIICTLPRARDRENLNVERTGLGIVRRQLKAYGECYPNLIKHDRRYPTLEYLWKRTVAGYDGDAGVKLILAAAAAADPRPVWICNWGTGHDGDESSFKQALDLVLKERGPAGYARFKKRFRLSSADKFGDHTRRDPPWPIWIDTFRPDLDGKRWYHRFSALTARAGGFDLKRDLLTGHGPLAALYPTNTGLLQKEGDTMTFLYLVPTGINDPMQPTWGSWAGRYGPNENYPGRPYFWANQKDRWQGTTHRDNTLKRWAVALQNDFKVRLNWCVAARFAKANHPPQPHCQGDSSGKILSTTARAGSELTLSAAGSNDPDGDGLRYRWYVYPEAATYAGDVRIRGAATADAVLQAPADAAGKTIHVILEVTDSGSPALTRYRRVIVVGAR